MQHIVSFYVAPKVKHNNSLIQSLAALLGRIDALEERQNEIMEWIENNKTPEELLQKVDWITTGEAQELLRKSQRTIYRYIEQGKLLEVDKKPDGSYLLSKEEVIALKRA